MWIKKKFIEKCNVFCECVIMFVYNFLNCYLDLYYLCEVFVCVFVLVYSCFD